MKIIFALVFLLAGCSFGGSEFVGSVHGYCGTASNDDGKLVGCPTIDGDGKPMGSRTRLPDGTVILEEMYSTYTDGNVSATGNAANKLAEAEWFEKLGFLCAIAKDAGPCTRNDPPPELLAAFE